MANKSQDFAEEEKIKSVVKLQGEGGIRLKTQPVRSRSLTNYLKSCEAIWYWFTIVAGVMAVLMVFIKSESSSLWIFVRNLLALMFIFFLPGFAFMKALFQSKKSQKTFGEGLEAIQRITLSIVMSIVLVSMIGLLLFYSPLGLSLTTVVITLFTFTMVFASAAVIRDYLSAKK